MDYTVVVVTEGNDPPGLAYIAPYAATSIAEYFMEPGRDVLIVYDDLTHHARAYRELSLLLRRPPGREAFPGDIFYIHSRLLERATHLRPELGGGSLTALPIIETEAQNISAYIPTNLISITDGQIYLSPSLFELGVLPAVDVGKSVSRVGGKAQRAAYRAVAGDLKLAYAQFEELETFARFGARLDEDTRKIIEHGRRIRACLKQPEFAPVSVPAQIAILLALTAELFDAVPLEQDDGRRAGRARGGGRDSDRGLRALRYRRRIERRGSGQRSSQIARKALAGFQPGRKPPAKPEAAGMSDTTASLRRKIDSAGDLRSVVRTMKALAASNIGQYEKAVRALADYYRSVELGLGVCFRRRAPAGPMTEAQAATDAGPSARSCSARTRDWWAGSTKWWPIMRSRRSAACPAEPGSGRSASASMPAWQMRVCRWRASSPCRIRSRPSPRWSGRFCIESETRSAGADRRVPSVLQPPHLRRGLCARQQRLLPLDEAWRRELAEIPWPTREPARGHGRRQHDPARAHPRVSVRLAVPRLRRIARERERQPPGRDAARRQEHRRTAGGPQRDIPPFAPERHRRGTVRRDRRLRGYADLIWLAAAIASRGFGFGRSTSLSCPEVELSRSCARPPGRGY